MNRQWVRITIDSRIYGIFCVFWGKYHVNRILNAARGLRLSSVFLELVGKPPYEMPFTSPQPILCCAGDFTHTFSHYPFLSIYLSVRFGVGRFPSWPNLAQPLPAVDNFPATNSGNCRSSAHAPRPVDRLESRLWWYRMRNHPNRGAGGRYGATGSGPDSGSGAAQWRRRIGDLRCPAKSPESKSPRWRWSGRRSVVGLLTKRLSGIRIGQSHVVDGGERISWRWSRESYRFGRLNY
jgi:hypothetical protein